VAHHFGPHLGVPTHLFLNSQIWGTCTKLLFILPFSIVDFQGSSSSLVKILGVCSNGIKSTIFCGEIFPFSKKTEGTTTWSKV
jgi:hypothetical protein